MSRIFVTLNQIVNPGAEVGSSASDYTTSVTPIGWSTDSSVGSPLTSVKYSIGGPNELNNADSASISGGLNYFAGGPNNDEAYLYQTIDISQYASDIAAGRVTATVSGYFGGYLSQNDRLSLFVNFLNASNSGRGVNIGGYLAADRSNQTSLILASKTLDVQADAVMALVRLYAFREDPTYNDGYADNLSLIFTILRPAPDHDFGGDGTSDILFRNTSGITYLWQMNNAAVTSGGLTSTQVNTNWQIKGLADFNGDGKADIFWTYNNVSNSNDSLNGVSYITLQSGANAMSGGGVVQQLASVWQVAGVSDFNGDGISDVLYRNSSTGQLYLDLMNGTTVKGASGFTSQQVTDQNWQVVATGDFDADGKSDILWRFNNTANASDPLNGALYEWTMNGTSVTSGNLLSQQPGSGKWSVVGTGDFDGDGTADILFRYQNVGNLSDPLNGFTYIDFMNGTNVSAASAPTQWQVDNNWTVAAISDFDGDGKSDILFQQVSTGNTYIWTMNGTATTAGNFTSQQSGLGWTVQNGVLDS